MSHKPAYGGRVVVPYPNQKELKPLFDAVWELVGVCWAAGYDSGFTQGKKQTTTSSSVPVSPETNIGRGARRKPGSRAGTKK